MKTIYYTVQARINRHWYDLSEPSNRKQAIVVGKAIQQAPLGGKLRVAKHTIETSKMIHE